MIVKQPFVIFTFEIHFNNLAIPTLLEFGRYFQILKVDGFNQL